MSTLNLFADDLPAATRFYAELLGTEPYFRSEDVGRGPGYVEFRIGDYQHELGLLDRRFAPPGSEKSAGCICYWHVDDIHAAHARLIAMGATPHAPITEQGPGFVTASVVDPFGNVLGVMSNRHYLSVLESLRGAR